MLRVAAVRTRIHTQEDESRALTAKTMNAVDYSLSFDTPHREISRETAHSINTLRKYFSRASRKTATVGTNGEGFPSRLDDVLAQVA